MTTTSESIGVNARLRKLLPWEAQIECLKIDVDEKTIGIPNKQKRTFPSDSQVLHYHHFSGHIFSSEHETNEKVFKDMCQPLCDNLLNEESAYNSMLVAYGQTGSGKTYTLLGKRQQKIEGILPMAIDYISSHSKIVDRITLSAVEIYGLKENKILFFDLFDDKKTAFDDWSQKKPFILSRKSTSDCIWNLFSVTVSDSSLAYRHILHAQKNAHYAPTAMNPQSSRGHIIFIVNVHYIKTNTFNHFIVVDLAGSEGMSALPSDFRKKYGLAMYHMRRLEAGIINFGLGQLQTLFKEINAHNKSTSRKSKNGNASASTSIKVKGSGLRKFLIPFLAEEYHPLINILFTFSQSTTNIESTRGTLRVANFISNVKITVKKFDKKAYVDPKKVIDELEKKLQEKDLLIEQFKKKIEEQNAEIRKYKKGREERKKPSKTNDNSMSVSISPSPSPSLSGMSNFSITENIAMNTRLETLKTTEKDLVEYKSELEFVLISGESFDDDGKTEEVIKQELKMVDEKILDIQAQKKNVELLQLEIEEAVHHAFRKSRASLSMSAVKAERALSKISNSNDNQTTTANEELLKVCTKMIALYESKNEKEDKNSTDSD